MTSEEIRALRLKGEWSFEGLARKIGVSAPTVWRWENGKSKPHKKFEKELRRVLSKLEEKQGT